MKSNRFLADGTGWARPARMVWLVLVLLGGSLFFVGCAAVTNPIADGIPVRKLPEQYLAQPREEEIELPIVLLGQKQPDVYLIGPGDTLAIFVGGVVGEEKQIPPVRLEGQDITQPALGFPYAVREDGTIKLPIVPPIEVEGLSLRQAEEKITKVYLDKEILKKENVNVNVDLFEPRRHRVLVIREDAGGLAVSPTGVIGNSSSGQGFVINLPAYENDVLHAVAQTGGLPGLDAKEEVIIQRGYLREGEDPTLFLQWLQRCQNGHGQGFLDSRAGQQIQIVRIPLRLKPGESVPFKPEDVILETGDVVFIESRRTEVFYTGGILIPRQYPLPRDVDLRVVDAIALAGGPLVNGLISQNNLSGQVAQSGLGSATPSLVTVLRRTKGRGQIRIKVDLYRALRDQRENIIIMPGDVIIMQETVGQALSRYLTAVIQFNFVTEIIDSPSALWRKIANFP